MIRRIVYLLSVSALLAFPACKESAPVNVETPEYAISGRIVKGDRGLSGVSVTNGNSTAMTDSLGCFRFVRVRNGSYTITPTKAGESFVPPTRHVLVRDSNATGVDFCADEFRSSVSGTVTCPSEPPEGVVVEAYRLNTFAGSASVGTDGTFRLDSLPSGSYTIKPRRGRYLFQPESTIVQLSGTPRTGIDFTARIDPTKARFCSIALVDFDAHVRTLAETDSAGIPLSSTSTDTLLPLGLHSSTKLPLLSQTGREFVFGKYSYKSSTYTEETSERLTLTFDESNGAIASIRYAFSYRFNGYPLQKVDTTMIDAGILYAQSAQPLVYERSGPADLSAILQRVHVTHFTRQDDSRISTISRTLLLDYRLSSASTLRISLEL